MCRVLGLFPSGYHAWLQRPASARARRDAELVTKIHRIHDENRRVYGRPRIFAELEDEGEQVSEKRVGRLMRQEGIWGVSRRRRGPKTTKRCADARPAADLIERDFTAASTMPALGLREIALLFLRRPALASPKPSLGAGSRRPSGRPRRRGWPVAPSLPVIGRDRLRPPRWLRPACDSPWR